MRSNRGTIRSASMKRNDTGVCGRIEAPRCSPASRDCWIGHEHPTIAGNRAWSCPLVTSGRVIGDDRDRSVESLGLGIPGRLLDRQACALRNDSIVDRNFRIMETWLVASSPFARKSVPKGGSSALLAASSSLPSDVKAISSTRVVPPVEMLCLIGLVVGGIEINHLERAVTIAGIEPAAMGRNAVRPGVVVVDGARMSELNTDKARWSA